MKTKQLFTFIGSYANPENPGIYVCKLDTATGRLSLESSMGGLLNPCFFDIDEQRKKLYVLTEFNNSYGHLQGAIAAFDIDVHAGKLTLLNQEPALPAPACHLKLDHTRQCLFTSSYRGGMAGVSSVLSDGKIGPLEQMHQHTGSSVLPVQSQPRTHSMIPDPSNTFVAASDLGLDLIKIYKLDADKRELTFHSQVQTAPGAGPRHFVFHQYLPFSYVINELNATITAYGFDQSKGPLHEIQTISTLPVDHKGDNACADIHISPDGKHLYGSNRGHNSIAVFNINTADGTLSLIEHVSTIGDHPRNFAISPDGRFVLSANRFSNHIVTFQRDEHTGRLTPTAHELQLNEPVCIKFASFELD